MLQDMLFVIPNSLSFADFPLKICIRFVQCWTNVEDGEPTLYKCYTNVFVFSGIDLGNDVFQSTF